ncbi:peptidase family m28 domain-containing protein [Ditylenchus destructor]|uniref:Peptidase family m28 domain-containing protein n=1 Tax=Ditylenchus destructor TaxID=166010 RepID=A0AAD4R0Z5_9BILA|nr:peptidase family m28 domain-containing protein [Ditylenchus destructor]
MVHTARQSSLLDSRMFRALGALGICIVLGVVVAIIGLSHKSNPGGSRRRPGSQDEQNEITTRLLDNMDGGKILQNLKALTTLPHVAGTTQNNKVAEKIAEIWRQNGLQDVHFNKYNVLLSYPDYANPNHVSILDSSGSVVFQSSGVSPVVIQEEQSAPGAGVQWLAYAGNGTVEGDLVYAHYGTPKDFKTLEEMGVSVKGKIAIMRYHTEFRGGKVMQAQLHGAIGAILYSDPAEIAQDGTTNEDVYPSKAWLPPNGVQRGSLMMADGDVLSPLYPSRSDLYPRRTIEEAKAENMMPSIPALPLGYSDAYRLLSRLGGQSAPPDWQGGLNFTYNVGPGFKNDADGSSRIRVEVHSSLQVKEIQNVISYIYGSEEPDEYVILGNHFDAWVYGSIDPNSATATLAEVGRAFTQTMQQTGWRPARTIMFCAWDAEEYGLIGSTEFVEDFANILTDRAVAYLNVDLISANGTLNADTVPTMFQAVVDAAKKIPNPMKSELDLGRKTVYDTWLNARPSSIPERPDYPQMKVPGGGSDHHSFLVYLGIPVVDFVYQNTTSKSQYPLYHSLYETPWTNEHLLDPENFAVHRAVGQYWAELARSFADAPVLPLNASVFSQIILNTYIANLTKRMEPYKSTIPEMQDASDQLLKMTEKAKEFVSRSTKFEADVFEWKKVLWLTPEAKTAFAGINKRLKAVDRCFVNPRGMDSGPAKRHVLFSLSGDNTYAGVVMSAVNAELNKLIKAKPEERATPGRNLAIQISTVQYSIQCAINTLNSMI